MAAGAIVIALAKPDNNDEANTKNGRSETGAAIHTAKSGV